MANRKYKGPPPRMCPACEGFVMPQQFRYHTCNMCGWYDDPNSDDDPDAISEPNRISLNDYREFMLDPEKLGFIEHFGSKTRSFSSYKRQVAAGILPPPQPLPRLIKPILKPKRSPRAKSSQSKFQYI